MVIVSSILLLILLVDSFGCSINKGLPIWEEQICLWPMEIIYRLPRIIAPFLIAYPIMLVKPMWCFVWGLMLYAVAFGIKYLFWRFAYGMNVFKS